MNNCATKKFKLFLLELLFLYVYLKPHLCLSLRVYISQAPDGQRPFDLIQM